MGGEKCKCGIPAKIVTSWTHDNPGRKFYVCKFSDYHSGREGCGYFGWHDKNMEGWQKAVINDLLLERRLLSHEVAFLKSELSRIEGTRIRAEVQFEQGKSKRKSGGATSSKKGSSSGMLTGMLVGSLVTLLVVCLVFTMI